MSPSRHQVTLFQFSPLGMPNNTCAITMEELVGVGDLMVQRLPFAPAPILGVALWQDQPASVIDLSWALRGQATGVEAAAHYAIVRSVIRGHAELLAWQIGGGTQFLHLPSQVARSDDPA
ncbi:MAG: hypothetical protein GYB68_07935, partial [Chloroflexi bacterium]|nr:hypothetical protein [Chloroflexota bacterium]